MGNIALDKYLSQLVGNGSIVQGAAILSISSLMPTTPTQTFPKIEPESPTSARIREILLAHKNLTIKLPEALHILEHTTKNTLHMDYLNVAGNQYLITSVQERSLYGRSVSTPSAGGIAIVKTAKCILVALYPATAFSTQAIPTIEAMADIIPQ
eukprot:TRINITY_DN16822_c0_g1_i1.p1 TRINITY_DN16822_c0_g1~~TRINITY_DN16822_c0_g1_i1.p1  ORF type:complete len:163 (+),score=17.45 TRINITY_DN16822_c0_g1_i1:30-491(+)